MTEPLDPNKYHVLTPAAKKRLIFAGLFFVLIVLPFLLRAYYRVAINRPSQSGKEVNTIIQKGESVSDIATRLQQEGAINSDFLFNFYVYTGNYGKNIQAGSYKIPAGSSLVEVVEIIQHGTDDVRMTFLEGWRVEEFARLASSQLNNIDFQEFITISQDREGYLFPDTYYVSKDIQEEELLELFIDNFKKRTAEILTEENLAKSGLTEEEVLIFASMVEREVRSEEDRQVVAGILLKRWREGMQLDVDATTQYAVSTYAVCGSIERCAPKFDAVKDFGWWPFVLTSEDLNLDSPYNTRKNVGLPPAPISNPGLSSIRSVINAVETPFYFYLTDKEGTAHYAATLDQHNVNVAKYIY